MQIQRLSCAVIIRAVADEHPSQKIIDVVLIVWLGCSQLRPALKSDVNKRFSIHTPQPIANMRSIGTLAFAAISGGTRTSYTKFLSVYSSFSSVIIFIYWQT